MSAMNQEACMIGNNINIINIIIFLFYLSGAHIIREWTSECTHLVMTEISITAKVICALIDQCPIVKPEYVAALAQRKIQDPLPDANKYDP